MSWHKTQSSASWYLCKCTLTSSTTHKRKLWNKTHQRTSLKGFFFPSNFSQSQNFSFFHFARWLPAQRAQISDRTLKAYRVWPLCKRCVTRYQARHFVVNSKVVNFVHLFTHEGFGLYVVILCSEFRIFSKQMLRENYKN